MGEAPDLDSLRATVLREQVRDIVINAETSMCELIRMLGDAHGFMAGHIYRAAHILYEMINDSDTTRFLAFTGNIVSTGMRGVLAQMVREGFFHAVITTCGSIDHDIARGTGHPYYKGDWMYDDAMLNALEIHRLGNILIPLENYGPAVEKFTIGLLEELSKVKKKWSVSELLYEAGKRISDENSILRAAYEKNIPVFVPGIFDGSFGSQIVFNHASTGIEVDLISDEKRIIEMVFSAKKLGALIIGGGISKHHTIWWAQLKDGLDYAIYVTTAVEYDGSLSGAQPREAISWGKIKLSGKHVVVYSDATIALPLILGGALCLMKKQS